MFVPEFFKPAEAERDAAVHRPSLSDLAGMGEARRWGESLARDFAEYREGKIKWDELDPGALLYGPPGTGKTLFAVALAQSCGVRLIATSFSEWIGSGDGCLGSVIEAIKAVFDLARQGECIIFIDEIDSLPARNHATRNDTWFNGVVNALLEQMSGVSGRPGVVVIAACNHFSRLDPALLRAGRLEKHIRIEYPGLDELPGVIRFHLTKDEARRLGELSSIAVMCVGMSPAEIGRLVREARRHARTWKHSLRQTDFIAALEADTRDEAFDWRVAVHEAGHAVAALTLGIAREVNVSIIGKGRSAGASSVEFKPLLMTARAIADHLTLTLSGRAAEEVVLGEVSGGSGGDENSDLAQANALAWRAVTELGFSQSAPLRWCGASVRAEYILGDNSITREVHEMLERGYDAALRLAIDNRAQVETLARALVERRALAHKDIQAIVGMKKEESGVARKRA